LTDLPLLPATESVKKVGNEPVKLPDSAVCNGKLHGNFYTLYNYFSKDNIKLTDAVAWYASHLSGFRRLQAATTSKLSSTTRMERPW
jgi:hypothetical protein